ncbi:hypothetical protein RJ639_040287 [Escallonia herrerae]|uniref:Metallo-beta-lactamase domain-containing protein n=1 Tax=Escallonia herrerae TaxID=1293975 RepID=A0AA88WGM5_9ASTE|nr:hypothetical protein RJ639_040287 [Escallonia herrerae]
MAIECLVLGQEVGKSCVVVTINGKRIMFDCGMHMGYDDHRRYPDFSLISESGHFDAALTCIVITHFHLDHIGALPYFTEVCGYTGPIYMTYPTKALAPLMLEDYRKVMVDRRGEEEQFSSENVLECLKKVTAVDLRQTLQVDKDLQIRAYYAGHVLGAAMFYAKVGESAIVYTGDYNMTPDRHLGAAQIDRLQLDLLITEYGIILDAVHKCVANGGKVLIPTFALGRAQYPVAKTAMPSRTVHAGLTIQANMYYKMLINWTSQKRLGKATISVPRECNVETSSWAWSVIARLGAATGIVPGECYAKTALGDGRESPPSSGGQASCQGHASWRSSVVAGDVREARNEEMSLGQALRWVSRSKELLRRGKTNDGEPLRRGASQPPQHQGLAPTPLGRVLG